MSRLAHIFREHGPAYRAAFGDRMLPSHKRVMRDIECCRTPVMGGSLYHCPSCGEQHYSYHSCRNRHCPTCEHDRAQHWLDTQSAALLPVTYYLVTFTLPAQLRCCMRSHQKDGYGLMFSSSAKALADCAADPKHLGGHIGMTGVLHTWARTLAFHPHIHYIIPGGAISPDRTRWLPAKYPTFFLPVRKLSALFRRNLLTALVRRGIIDNTAADTLNRIQWVVHCQPVGSGERAMRYLSRYVYRVALSNTRSITSAAAKVSFTYRDSSHNVTRRMTLTAFEFIRRFLQHVLPKGFQKVRHYGFLHHHHRKHSLALIRRLLRVPAPEQPQPTVDTHEIICKHCGATLVLISNLSRGVTHIRPPTTRSPRSPP